MVGAWILVEASTASALGYLFKEIMERFSCNGHSCPLLHFSQPVTQVSLRSIIPATVTREAGWRWPIEVPIEGHTAGFAIVTGHIYMCKCEETCVQPRAGGSARLGIVSTALPPPGCWQLHNGPCEPHKAGIFPASAELGWGEGKQTAECLLACHGASHPHCLK